MPKILFTGVHRPHRSPSQRYRIEQFLAHLVASGYEYDYTYIVSEHDDTYFYKPGNYLKKALFLLKSFMKRWVETFRFDSYDIIFVQREAMFTGAYFYERLAAKSKARLVYDFDDAIWMQHVSEGNKKLAFLKDPHKTSKIIKLADCILAGNEYLRAYALVYNPNTKLFPTVVDTNRYRRQSVAPSPQSQVCIGWSGSFSTFEHFMLLDDVLRKLYLKYGERIKIKIIGAPKVSLDYPVAFAEWTEETEVYELSEMDIGIMPLQDSAWNQGKCGLKGLLYMSLGIPAVLSPVGVNLQIIKHGSNGYLPQNDIEWIDLISKLIDDKQHRLEIGEKGRLSVIENYSVDSYKEKFVGIFNDLIQRDKREC